MLKLEKNPYSPHLSIRLRTKKPSFNLLFWQAFAYAVAIHVMGFFLFRIEPFKRDSAFRFPPIHVQTPLSSPIHITCQEELNKKETSYIAPPPHCIPVSSPFFPKYRTEEPGSPLFPPQLNNLDSQPLYYTHLPRLIPHSYTPLYIALEGPLATLSMLPLLIPSYTSTQSLESYRILYQVQVDGPSGQIIWYEQKETSLSPSLYQVTTSLLLKLKFIPIKEISYIPGEIAFIFTKEVGAPFEPLLQELVPLLSLTLSKE